MKQLFKTHPYAVGGFVVAMAVTLFFLFRITASAIYWNDPAHHNETVKPWMTIGYVAKSWKLSPREIDVMADLPLPQEGRGPLTIKEIATLRGVEVDEVIRQVNATIVILQLKRALQ